MKEPFRFTPFTKEEIKHLLLDLKLYAGNVKKITGLREQHKNAGGGFGGLIHTSMDTFKFTASPLFCGEESWTVEFTDPVMSLLRGNRHFTRLTFPKIHRDPALQERYRVANLLYKAYEGYSNVSEASRMTHYERILGYDRLRSFRSIIEAIIRDFRSFDLKQRDKERAKFAKN